MIYLLLTWLVAPLLWWRAYRRRGGAVRRVLVIQTAKIGDFVATTPVYRALRMALPQAEIRVLLHPVNEPLAAGLDCIDRIIALPSHGFKGWAGKRWLLAELRQDYDATIVLTPNLVTLLAPFWAGVPRRISVLPDRRQGSARLAWPFLTHGEPHGHGQLFRETALRALAGLGLRVDASVLALPAELARHPVADARARALLGGRGDFLVGVGLGAGNRMKALAEEQLLALARGILREPRATLVLIGTSVDQSVAQRLGAALPAGRVMDTTGQWTLAELPSLLAELGCFVGVDSGATYMADALGVPVVDFMGPADAMDQRPLGPHAIVVGSREACAPCSHAFDAPYQCRLATRACMLNAPLEAMVAQVLTYCR